MADDEFVEMRMMDVPGYMDWSQRLLDEHAAYISHLDATSIVLRRGELAGITDEFFDGLLAELIADLGHAPGH